MCLAVQTELGRKRGLVSIGFHSLIKRDVLDGLVQLEESTGSQQNIPEYVMNILLQVKWYSVYMYYSTSIVGKPHHHHPSHTDYIPSVFPKEYKVQASKGIKF